MAPAILGTIVRIRLLLWRPGTRRRAIRPTINPHSIQPRIVPLLISRRLGFLGPPVFCAFLNERLRLQGGPLPALDQQPGRPGNAANHAAGDLTADFPDLSPG